MIICGGSNEGRCLGAKWRIMKAELTIISMF